MQGKILNEIYQVKELLSRRGGRETYLVQDVTSQKLVVIKLLKFGLGSQWEDFKLFAREAQTLKNIDHPAIPKYLDYFELDLPDCKGFALVQTYIAAPSLEATLKGGRNFSEAEIQQIAEALLHILLYLHQRQPSIVHRDIKPSNILLTDRTGNSVGKVYLIDFGAVKSIAATEGGTITVVGTYGYMPPEQFGGRTTPASDLYSLGATLIYLATGVHPCDLPSKDGRILFEEQVNLSYSTKTWIRKLTEPSLDNRYSSAAESLQALIQPSSLDINLSKKTEIVKQPAFSKIKLRKTAKEIDIVVPAPGFTADVLFLIFFAIAWNIFLVFWTGFALMAPLPINILFASFSLPFWAVGLTMIGTVLFSLWGKTRLYISAEQISLTYECLGIKYQRPKATARANINALECSENGWRRTENGEKTQIFAAVTVWANGVPYSLRNSMVNTNNSHGSNRIFNYDPASIELSWLAKELSQWLDLPLTSKNIDHS